MGIWDQLDRLTQLQNARARVAASARSQQRDELDYQTALLETMLLFQVATIDTLIESGTMSKETFEQNVEKLDLEDGEPDLRLSLRSNAKRKASIRKPPVGE